MEESGLTPDRFDYSLGKLVELFKSPHFPGFTADNCGSCRKSANVPAGPGEWICECGNCNLQGENTEIPHENPNLGPSRELIYQAAEKAREERG